MDLKLEGYWLDYTVSDYSNFENVRALRFCNVGCTHNAHL